MKQTKKVSWGFDTKDMDVSVRPQDDFYHYANGGWLAKNKIPETESRWGMFMQLRYKTDLQLHQILEDLDGKKSLPVGSPERMMRDFYRSGMDMKRRTTLGLLPLASFIGKIRSITDGDELQKAIANLHVLGVGVFFGAGIDQDAKDSTKYMLHIYQDGLGMPDRDYYLDNDAESVRVRTAYVQHVTRFFKLMGRSNKEATEETKTVMSIETELARASMNKVERREIEKTYNKKTAKELARIAPAIDWSAYFKNIQAGEPKTMVVMQPKFLSALSKLLATRPIADIRTYLEWHLVNDYASALSPAFINESFSFYGTVLGGAKTMKPLWRRTLAAVNGSLGELLGRIYVARHFSPQAKRKMNALVDDLFAAYERRIKALDWMSPATKKKALQKLRAMSRKIGYPDKWRSYTGLVIDAEDFVGNLMRSAMFEHAREMKKLGKPVNRDEWFMYPQTVNAYNAPNLNDIAFPAAILQPPFFDLEADDAVNYGSIGSVIGHEMTHGFDDEGSKFDSKGNLKKWWTPTDRKRFEAKGALLVKQFNAYEVAPNLCVNGKLTLGENIADLGGAAIAFDAYQMKLKKTGRKDIDELTPEQRFFLSYAKFDCEHSRPEFLKMQVLTDPHSPGMFRINGPASNLEEFYAAFEVKKTDKLYRTPSSRAKIW